MGIIDSILEFLNSITPTSDVMDVFLGMAIEWFTNLSQNAGALLFIPGYFLMVVVVALISGIGFMFGIDLGDVAHNVSGIMMLITEKLIEFVNNLIY